MLLARKNARVVRHWPDTPGQTGPHVKVRSVKTPVFLKLVLRLQGDYGIYFVILNKNFGPLSVSKPYTHSWPIAETRSSASPRSAVYTAQGTQNSRYRGRFLPDGAV